MKSGAACEDSADEVLFMLLGVELLLLVDELVDFSSLGTVNKTLLSSSLSVQNFVLSISLSSLSLWHSRS